MADPKNIVNKLVDLTLKMTGGPGLTGDATPAQINKAIDGLHFLLFGGEVDNTPTSDGSYKKVDRIFEELEKRKGKLGTFPNAALSLVEGGLNVFVGGGDLPDSAKELLGNLGLPVALITEKDDVLAIINLLQDLDGVNAYIDNAYTTFNPNAPPVVPDPDEKTSVLPDEDAPDHPLDKPSAVQSKMAGVLRGVGVMAKEDAATDEVLQEKIKAVVSADSRDTYVQSLGVIRDASEAERYINLKKRYEADKENFEFSAEEIEENEKSFSEDIAKDPAKLFAVLDNAGTFLDYENYTQPFTYNEYAQVVQKTLNIYCEILNRNGFDIDRPIDLDAGTASLDDDGIDGLFGPRTNQSLQEWNQVMNFILTGKPGSKVYTPEMGKMWTDNNYHQVLGRFMSPDDVQALVDASYIVRDNGAKFKITPETFVRALNAWANPPKEGDPEVRGEPGYENYKQHSQNGKYRLYDHEMPEAKVRLFPLDAAQEDNVEWLQSKKLASRVPNGLPLINELMHIYSGFDLSHADPEFTPAFDDGTVYARDPKHGQAARLQEVFEKVLRSTPPPDWKVMEEYIMIAAGAIGDLPFGLIGDKEAFVTAVQTALDDAEEEGVDKDGNIVNPTAAARAFGNVLRHNYNTSEENLANYREPALYTQLPKQYPDGELPIAADDLDFTVTLTSVDEYDIYAAYMQQTTNLERQGQAAQPFFFRDRIAGVDVNGGFVVYEIPKAATDAILDKDLTSLDELKEALRGDPQAYESFVKAHELASQYNMPGLHMLSLKARENVKLQVPTSGDWRIDGSNMERVKAAQGKIDARLTQMDDDFRAQKSKELFDTEEKRLKDLKQAEFDGGIKESYLTLLKSKDPADKESRKELKKLLRKYDGKTDEEKIDACLAAMRNKPSDYPEYLQALKKYWEDDATWDALAVLMNDYRDGQFNVDLQTAMDDYHASDEYQTERTRITSELRVGDAPWIDRQNLHIDDVAHLSETYDINDIINAYNAQKPEGPLFFKDGLGQTHVFYIAKSGIATVQKFDAEEIIKKQAYYNTAYDFRSGSASALKDLMKKAEESLSAYEKALQEHNDKYPHGEPYTEADKAEYTASWANIGVLQQQRQKDAHAIEVAADQGKAASAGRLKSEFPQLAELCTLYNQTPDQIVRTAKAATVFSGGNGVTQPTGRAPSVDLAASSGVGASYHTPGSLTGVGTRYNGKREVNFHSMPWPVWPEEKEAFKVYEQALEKTNNSPVRQVSGGRTYLYVRADEKYLSRVKKQIEARETANADLKHDGKTLAEWRTTLKTHQNNITNGLGKPAEETQFADKAKAAITALEVQMGTHELNEIVSEYGRERLDLARNNKHNRRSPDLMIKIDVTDEVGDIAANGYDAAHAAERYPALTMISQQYYMGTPESLYTSFFDPTSGQRVPTFNDKLEFSLSKPSQRLAGRTDIHPMFDGIDDEPQPNMGVHRALRLSVKDDSRAFRRLTSASITADTRKDRLDRLDKRLVKMENEINERLAEMEPGKPLSEEDRAYIDEYKELTKQWVAGMDALPEYAAKKSQKYYDRIAATQAKRDEYSQTATTMTGISQSMRLDQRANRVGVDLKSR